MKRNQIIKLLIAEGFTHETLAKMNDIQLNVLSDRILTEQTTTTGIKPTATVSSKNPNLKNVVTDLNRKGINVNVTEDDLKEEGECNECGKSEMDEETPLSIGRDLRNRKIQKLVDEINTLISMAVDKNGDPISVIDNTSTWESPMIYEPILYNKKGQLKIVNSYPMEDKKNSVEIINPRDMEDEGIPSLLFIRKMYKRSLKQHASETGRFKPERDEDLQESEKNKKDDQKKLNEWVERLVNENYHSMTTKGEIVNLIRQKLTEASVYEKMSLPEDTNECVFADGTSLEQSIAQKVANDNAMNKFNARFPNKPYIKHVETAHRTEDGNFRYIVGIKLKPEVSDEKMGDDEIMDQNKEKKNQPLNEVKDESINSQDAIDFLLYMKKELSKLYGKNENRKIVTKILAYVDLIEKYSLNDAKYAFKQFLVKNSPMFMDNDKDSFFKNKRKGWFDDQRKEAEKELSKNKQQDKRLYIPSDLQERKK